MTGVQTCALPISSVAAAAPTDVGTIGSLNPHVLRGMLPLGDPLWVRVPPGTATGFDERFAALDSADRVPFTRLTSKKGESMASIARKHKLTAKQLGWYNQRVSRLKSGNLVPGQTILVPSVAVATAAKDVPNPSIERYPRRRSTTAKTPPKKKTPSARPWKKLKNKLPKPLMNNDYSLKPSSRNCKAN